MRKSLNVFCVGCFIYGYQNSFAVISSFLQHLAQQRLSVRKRPHRNPAAKTCHRSIHSGNKLTA